jgi:hypothetical protein
MPPRCNVCCHPDLEAIDRALVQGATQTAIALQYGSESHPLSKFSMSRHVKKHLPQTMVKAFEERQEARGGELVSLMDESTAKARKIARDAETAGEKRTVLMAVRELLRIVELQAKLQGSLNEGTTVNVVVSPQWLEVRAVVLDALQPYPEARAAVSGRLLELEAGS